MSLYPRYLPVPDWYGSDHKRDVVEHAGKRKVLVVSEEDEHAFLNFLKKRARRVLHTNQISNEEFRR